MFKFKNVWLRISIIIGTIVILFYSSEPIIYGDSSRYLEPSLRGSILYSLMIETLTLLFSSLNAVVVLQTFLICFAIIYFIETVSDFFDLNNVIKIIIILILFLPILKFYRNILTEAMTYAITIFFVSSVINLIYNFKLRNLVKVSIFTLLLLISKKQFLFLIPVVFVTYFGIFLINKTKSVFFLLIASFLTVISLNIAITNFDKYIKISSGINTSSVSNGKGSPYYFTYIDAIYISSTEDYRLFSNPKSKQLLKKILYEMNKQEALREHYDGRGHYGLSY